MNGTIYNTAELARTAAEYQNSLSRELELVHMWITEAANNGQLSMYYNTPLRDETVASLIDEGFNVIFNLDDPQRIPMVISWKQTE